MIEILNWVIDFFSKYGTETVLAISLLFNFILTYAWIKREKYLELTEVTLSKPFMKFQLNKDEKYREMADKIIILETENKILKKEVNKPYIIIILILIVFGISSAIRNSKNAIRDVFKSDEKKEPEKEENKLDLNNPPSKVVKIKNNDLKKDSP